MILLNTSTLSQSISVIPRVYANVFDMSIRDDSTNTTVIYNITQAALSGNYITFDNIFSPVLVENHFYDITLYIGTEVIFKDRVFCTDQTVNQADNDYYNLNKNQYISDNSYNNDYIVI